MSDTVSVNNRLYAVVMHMKVAHVGWEMDNDLYVVDDAGEKQLVSSSHGRMYFSDEKELIEKMEEYSEFMSNASKALSLLRQTQDQSEGGEQ